MEIDGSLKQLAMELYTDAGEEVPKLSDPYHFESDEVYPIMIVDNIGAIHYFLKNNKGELFYDGWDV